ncbi:MAG TPA: hypothetical protein VKY51_01855 [Fredinandcohnia sp.]|nr:hypothetical protein [Fredinandcohnia sp.]
MVEKWVKTEWVVPRLGCYFIPEAEGTNELPAWPLDGRAVALYWRSMHEELARRTMRRAEAFPGPDAAPDAHVRAHEWRYGQKIEIKVLESIMDLFHRLLAPGEKVCAAECAHAAGGMPPEVIKRYLDSLDAREADLKRRLATTPYGQVYEDYMDERDAIRRWRARLVDLLEAGNR